MARNLTAWAPWLLVLLACDARQDDFENARDTWRRAAITDYGFAYRTTGFAPPVAGRITVTAGAVTAVEQQQAGTFALTVDEAPTIATLFDQIERTLNDGSLVEVSYDASFGYPVSASFTSGEEGDGFEVSEFSRR